MLLKICVEGGSNLCRREVAGQSEEDRGVPSLSDPLALSSSSLQSLISLLVLLLSFLSLFLRLAMMTCSCTSASA